MHDPENAMRARILDTAARLFAERGYNGIAMREIAEAVGVSKAGLYYHFQDKADLLLAILNAHLDATSQIVQAAQRRPTAREQIAALVRGLLALVPERGAVMRLAHAEIGNLAPQQQQAFGAAYHSAFIGAVEAMLRGGVARGELRACDTQAATWMLLGMLYPFFSEGAASRCGSVEHLGDLVVLMVFDGLALA